MGTGGARSGVLGEDGGKEESSDEEEGVDGHFWGLVGCVRCDGVSEGFAFWLWAFIGIWA